MDSLNLLNYFHVKLQNQQKLLIIWTIILKCIVNLKELSNLDRGSNFTSSEFNNFVTTENFKHILITSHTPHANGQVERYNKIITPIIAKLSESINKWYQILYKVVFALNNSVSKATNEMPSKLIFGILQKGYVCDTLSSVLATYDERDLLQLRDNAKHNIEKCQIYNEIIYNKNKDNVQSYDIGDYVMIRNIDTTIVINKKLIPEYKGPYVIKKIFKNDRCVVTDIDGFQNSQIPFDGIVSPDKMRPYMKIDC